MKFRTIQLFLLLNLHLFSFSNEILWEIALPGNIISNPIERVNGDIVFICEDRRVYSINNKNGRINWKIKPGGKLNSLLIASDGSIIVTDQETIYSMFSNGDLRWKLTFTNNINSNIETNDKGDIFLISNKSLYIIDRFGNKKVIKEEINTNSISSLENSLISYIVDNKLISLTYSGNIAWQIPLKDNPSLIKSNKNSIYLIYDTGTIQEYSITGNFVREWLTNNTNPKNCFFNSNENLIVTWDKSQLLIKDNELVYSYENERGLFYSNGIVIQTLSDWTIRGTKISDTDFYPSGKKQIIKSTLTRSNKNVWKDSTLKQYYENTMLDGNRTLIFNLFNDIKNEMSSLSLLDKFPNFYDILLLAISSQNKKDDIKQEAYRIIGLSKDISFLPYILSNLDAEKSYAIIPYIFFSLGQLGVDLDGSVLKTINKKIKNYYDETLAINGLYALYYINNYTNNEFVDTVFIGIEEILNSGYPQSIQNRCYEIIKKLN